MSTLKKLLTLCILLSTCCFADDNAAVSLCLSGDGKSCIAAGHNREYNYGDYAGAAQFFSKGCYLGNGQSCMLEGQFYCDGKGVKQDQAKGLGLINRGCDLNDPDACHKYGDMSLSGECGAIRSRARANYFYTKACVYGDKSACPLVPKSQLEAQLKAEEQAKSDRHLKIDMSKRKK